MKVLITGAGGQLGQALQVALTEHDLVPLTHAQLDVIKFGETREAIAAHRPALVINAAAYINVDGAETDQRRAYQLNSVGPRNLAIATAELGIPVVQVSTDYVFDGFGQRPYHEFDQVNPLSIYGLSKLAGETAVALHNPRHYIVRTAWLYHSMPSTRKNFPKTMLAQAQRDEVRVVSDQYGSPTYAPHLARAIERLIETGAYGLYHLAGGGGASWFELTTRLYELCGVKTRIRAVSTADFPRPATRPRYSVLQTFQDPQIVLPPWEEGLAEFSKVI